MNVERENKTIINIAGNNTLISSVGIN